MALTRRQVLLALGAGAASGVGAAGLWRWHRGTPPRTLGLGELAARDFDVCVIGSGPAGAVVARELVGRGARVVLLESGYALERMAERGFDPGRLDKYRLESALPYPIHATRLRALGGASNLWTGRCSRLHPIDFEPNAYTPPGSPWPLRYADLEPWYERAERTLGVRGGPLSEHHAPRSAPLPGAGDEVSVLRQSLGPLGLALDPSPSSRAPRFREGPVRAARDLLPGFSEADGASLVTGATVVGLDADASGAVTAARARSPDGAERSVRAGAFVVACGALESARLLLLSRSARWPEGLGNAGGQVGRGWNEHPNLTFHGELPADAAGGALARCHQFYDAYKRAGRGSAIFVFETSRSRPRLLRIGATLEMLPHPDNRLRLDARERDLFGSPGLRLELRWSPEDLRTFAAARRQIAALYEALDARAVEERPLSWSHHPAGTCRMGEDPARSVVDADLRVHGARNLFVLSSATFVTSGAAHPTLAIVALAHRLGERLGRI